MSQTYIPAALRRLVRERAGERCEYCLIPESVTFAPHWIDHIVAEKHGGKTEAENLANSCVLCNQRKGTDLSSIDPLTGNIVSLFHPRQDCWSEHFRLVRARIEPLTPSARATERLLQLNHPDRVEERDRLIEAGMYAVVKEGASE
jgi:hypothetical protein